MPERQALLEAAERLEVATANLSDKFSEVDLFAHETARQAKLTRNLAYWLVAGLVTQLIIMVVLAVALDRANDANSRSVRTQEYNTANCQAANESRAAQLQMWTDTAALIRAGGGGKASAAFADKLLANAVKTFKPRDCAQVAQGRVSSSTPQAPTTQPTADAS